MFYMFSYIAHFGGIISKSGTCPLMNMLLMGVGAGEAAVGLEALLTEALVSIMGVC